MFLNASEEPTLFISLLDQLPALRRQLRQLRVEIRVVFVGERGNGQLAADFGAAPLVHLGRALVDRSCHLLPAFDQLTAFVKQEIREDCACDCKQKNQDTQYDVDYFHRGSPTLIG